jgi:hypothetical protein
MTIFLQDFAKVVASLKKCNWPTITLIAISTEYTNSRAIKQENLSFDLARRISMESLF